MTEKSENDSKTPADLWLAEQWQTHRERISHLLTARIPAALLRRMGVDDLLQETYLACGRRMAYLQEPGDIPIYVRMRRIALQTLVDMERRHLSAGKRDAMKEIDPISDAGEEGGAIEALALFADSISSPRTHLERIERRAVTRRVLAKLPPIEELSNAECAAVQGVSQKASSIRYVRALKRFRNLLLREEAAEESRL